MKAKIFWLCYSVFFVGWNLLLLLTGIQDRNNAYIITGSICLLVNIVCSILWIYVILEVLYERQKSK